MKTLQEIQDDVCLTAGYWNYQMALSEFKKGKIETKVFNNLVREIGREVARESLRNASEQLKISFTWGEDIEKINSITDESNIPDLK